MAIQSWQSVLTFENLELAVNASGLSKNINCQHLLSDYSITVTQPYVSGSSPYWMPRSLLYSFSVERRPVPFEEIATFDEAAECGTAAVIAPISQIDDLDENKSYVIAKDGKPGPVCEKLYNKLRGYPFSCAISPATRLAA